MVCESCLIHKATVENDVLLKQEMRNQIAKLCNEKYGMHMVPEDINDCDGCKADSGRLFSGCQNCEIRKCANDRNIENCAYCTDYACDKLGKIFAEDPNAKNRLDEIRFIAGIK